MPSSESTCILTQFSVSPTATSGGLSAGLLAPPIVNPKIMRPQSRTFISEDGLPQPIEFFVASDAAAIVELTKRVLYLEDGDIAHIAEVRVHIHRLRSGEDCS